MTKIGIQLYSVRDELAKDMPGTLKKLSEIGYEAAEFYGEASFTVEEILKALKDNNMDICGYHTPWKYAQNEFLNPWIAYNKALGNRNIIIPALPGECTKTAADWLETADKFNKISEKLSKEGLRLGYHNHSSEFMPLEGKLPWDIFYSAVNKNIIAQYDIGNSLHGTEGIDAIAYHEKYIDRGISIHAKAYAADGGHKAIGEDDIDWEKYVEIIKKAAVTEYCIVEYEHEGADLFDKLEICYKTLKKFFGA